MSYDTRNQNAPRRGAWKTRLAMALGGLVVIAICVGIRFLVGGADPAKAESPRAGAARPSANARPVGAIVPVEHQAPVNGPPRAATAAQPAGKTAGAQTKYVAQIDGMPITRDELAQECLRHHGGDVLESMINKFLIAEECKRRGISISRAEVDGEIERMSQRFNLPVDQWLKMLKQERGIKPLQYASDIVWPMLALRKLAGDRLKVSQEDLQAAFEMHYGPAVRCRLISVHDRVTAEKIRAQAAAKPDEFGDLAKQYSEDSSASVKGLVPPIRMHTSFKEIEKAAFGMQDGDVSPVIAVRDQGDQFMILKREGLLPASRGPEDFARVKPQLEEVVREKKMRAVAGEIFRQLQESSKVENVMNNPQKSRAMPGVAATINGAAITLRELAEQCMDRYGEDVLEGLIHRRLIEMACKRERIRVSDEEMDQEVARAAAEMLPLKPDKTPDIEGWLETVKREQHVTIDVYRSDAVWPSVAMKKLAAGDVKVTEEDLRKGYDANYGPRVRCRAIVMNNARRAQEVWEMARKKPSVDNFGNLAEAYSIEPGSQALRGEVPPIQRYGGQPLLEDAAFKLKPGELSEIVQVGDKHIILFCEGYTQEPDQEKVTFAEVRDEIYRDLVEKKQRLAMAESFEHLKTSATIDNYLAGTSTSPNQKRVTTSAAGATGAATPMTTLRPGSVDPRSATRPAGPSAPRYK